MGVIVDQAQRDLAEDPTRSCHVEAPAGSGKTHLLTCRLLRLLARVDDPREIIALTFTKKAAGELNERISQLLTRAQHGADPADGEDQRLLELAKAALQRHPNRDLCSALQVMTFHAFCGLLVHHVPERAGVALSTEVLEETDQGMIQQQVARELLESILRGQAEPELSEAAGRRLLRLNNNAGRLTEQLSELIARRDLFEGLLHELSKHAGDPTAIGQYVRERVGRLVERRLQSTRAALAQTSLGQRWAEFHQHLESKGATAAATIGSCLPGSSWADLPSWQNLASCLLTQKAEPRKKLGPGSGFYPKFSAGEWGLLHRDLDQHACATLHSTVKLPQCDQPITDVQALLDLLRLGQEAIARYETLLGTMSAMDFVAAEQRAMAVISPTGPHPLERHLGHPIAHLLVDEFQDTSRNQWELIRSLCHGWRDGDGRTILLVGDPKQSIYSFRKAEVALFIAAKQGLPLHDDHTLTLTPVELSCNFRSAPALISWCNGYFEQLLRDPDPEGDEVSHLASRHPAGTEGTPADGVSLTLFAKPPKTETAPKDISDTDDETDTDARVKEARWLAARVRDELARPDPPASIGILLWTRMPQKAYLDALVEFEVPVQVKEGRLAHDTHAGRHMVNLTRALVRPHDDLAWAALLRAPWSWLPIDTLAELHKLDATGWRERLKRGAAADPAVARVHEAMAEGWRKLGREPLADTVERTWTRLEGPLHVARRYNTKGVEACRVLLDLMRAADAGLPQATLQRTEKRLDCCYEPADPRAVDSPVTMMTVHGAKGLEFDVVFAPYLDRDPTDLPGDAKTPPYLLERLPPPDNTYLMAVAHDQRKDHKDATYELLRELNGKRRKGEARRLCYVCYTRAKQRLYLSGSVTANAEKDEIRGGKSYLGWILDAEGLCQPDRCEQDTHPAFGHPTGTRPTPTGSPIRGTRKGAAKANTRPDPHTRDAPTRSLPPRLTLQPHQGTAGRTRAIRLARRRRHRASTRHRHPRRLRAHRQGPTGPHNPTARARPDRGRPRPSHRPKPRPTHSRRSQPLPRR